MKFHVCGGLDAPDWILANIVTLSTLVSAASFFAFAVFLLCQCSVYVCTHACIRFFLFGFVNDLSGTLKRKNQILAALCCSFCKPEIIVQSTDLSHLEGKAHVFLPELWPGCIF
jgi:hypothetical protein